MGQTVRNGVVPEWRRGWSTVATGVVGMTVETAAFGVTGVVLMSLMSEFGWSRTVVTSNIFILSALTFLMAPLAGRIIARFGLRRYTAASVLGAVVCMVLVPHVTANPASWFAIWLLFGLVNLGIGPLVWSAATTTLFDRSRGLALAITLSGSGVAYMVAPPLALLIMTEFGWRAVYYAVAAAFLLILLPLTLFWMKTSADFEVAPAAGAAARAKAELPGFTFAEALGRRQFWQLTLLSIVVALVEGAMAIHLFPILSEGGLDRAAAAGVAGLMGLAMIVGRLATGALMDRLNGVHVFAGAIVLVFLACLLVRVFDGSRMEGVAMSVLLGLGAGGTTNVIAYLASRYFGLKAYASVFGIFLGSFALAYGAAPAVASYVRDVTGSYVSMFTGSAVVMAAAVLVTLLLGKPPVFADAASLPEDDREGGAGSVGRDEGNPTAAKAAARAVEP